MLVVQVAGYLMLLEFGMTGATARILIDHKDAKEAGRYGETILTGGLVFSIQGGIIILLGLLLSEPVIRLFSIPSALEPVAIHLLKWQTIAAAIATGFRIFGSILYANQRIDLVMMVSAGSQIVLLLLVWVILAQEGGLWSLPWAMILSTTLSSLLLVTACRILHLFPDRRAWGRPTFRRFQEIFSLGKDIFLVNVGSQFLEASQLMIVSRTMGLTAAAIWAVCTKIFTLIFQLVTRIEGTAIVFFSEMMVRGERERLVLRFRQVYQLTAGLAAVSVIAAVGINRDFVHAWAGENLAWHGINNALLAGLVYINCVLRCHTDLILVSKRIQAYRYLNFIEGILFIVLAVWASELVGFPGVLLAALACALLLRGSYAVWRSSRYFNLPMRFFAATWLARSIAAALLLIPFVIAAPYMTSFLHNPWLQLGASIAWCGLPGIVILAFLALPRDLRLELAGTLSRYLNLGK